MDLNVAGQGTERKGELRDPSWTKEQYTWLEGDTEQPKTENPEASRASC